MDLVSSLEQYVFITTTKIYIYVVPHFLLASTESNAVDAKTILQVSRCCHHHQFVSFSILKLF